MFYFSWIQSVGLKEGVHILICSSQDYPISELSIGLTKPFFVSFSIPLAPSRPYKVEKNWYGIFTLASVSAFMSFAGKMSGQAALSLLSFVMTLQISSLVGELLDNPCQLVEY